MCHLCLSLLLLYSWYVLLVDGGNAPPTQIKWTNETCRMITGCLKPTTTNILPVLAGIAPSDIRRVVASCTERTRQTTNQRHPLNGHLGVVPRLKSRKSFIKCTAPINTTAKAARMELWRERLEPLDASVHPNISSDEHLPAGAEKLEGTQPVA